MALELSTAGINVKYAIGTLASRPTGSFITIPGVKSIPAFGDSVNALDCTPLSNETSHSYTEGLKDSGGAVGLTVNDYTLFRNAWTSMLAAYASSTATNKCVWVEYAYPADSGMDSFYYPAVPSELGYGGADVDEVLENIANFLPAGDFVFAAKSN